MTKNVSQSCKILQLLKFEIKPNQQCSLIFEGRQEVNIELHKIILLLEHRMLHKRLQFQC